jgi:tRNA-dihydrouridine synthase A
MFIQRVSQVDSSMHFIVHARKAWLNGLNPRENRRIPPLIYEYVFQIASEFPLLKFTLNGGLDNVAQIKTILENFQGDLMIGRALYNNPLFLYDIMTGIFVLLYWIIFIGCCRIRSHFCPKY